MKRFLILGLAAVIGLSISAANSEAARFRFGRILNRSYTTPYVQGHKMSSQNNMRAEGHTEGTGGGTTVDGKVGPVAPKPAPRVKADTKIEGGTEKTGTGTKVDGR